MACNTRIVRTRSADPWWNLAVEEYLLEQASQGETILYLWQNDNTVLVGRNQNPWRECRTDLLESDGGKLARRFSGGGTVYQDLGNLNFSFITGSGAYDPDKQLEVILDAVKSLGIAAEISGGCELTADGRKLSDKTLCFRKDNACHHGTIYVSTDIDRLSRYLHTAAETSAAVEGKPVNSRVVNLSELKADLDVETLADVLTEAFRKVYDSTAQVENCLRKCSVSRAALEELYCKHSSWAWRYGKAADFETKIDTIFPWGSLEIGFHLAEGIISDAAVYSNAIDADYIEGLAELLKGSRFGSEYLADRISAATVNERIDMASEPAKTAEDSVPDSARADFITNTVGITSVMGVSNTAAIPDTARTQVMTADIVKWLRTIEF